MKVNGPIGEAINVEKNFSYCELQTKQGDFVAYARIHKFTPQPDFVLWGDRTFKHVGSEQLISPPGAEKHFYQECFSIVITDANIMPNNILRV